MSSIKSKDLKDTKNTKDAKDAKPIASSASVAKPTTSASSQIPLNGQNGKSSRAGVSDGLQLCTKLNTGDQSVIQSVKRMQNLKKVGIVDEELSELGQSLEKMYATCKNEPVCRFPENFFNYADKYNEFFEVLHEKCSTGKKSTYLEYIRMLKRHSDKISAFNEIADNIIEIEAEVLGDENDFLGSL